MPQFPEVRFLLSAWRPDQFPADEGAEVSFAGRSNAGKSSALNAITGRTALARTSKTPGRTQLINFFRLTNGAVLVDLPGYGYAEVPEKVRRAFLMAQLQGMPYREIAGTLGVSERMIKKYMAQAMLACLALENGHG